MNRFQPNHRGKQLAKILHTLTASIRFRVLVTCILITALAIRLDPEKMIGTIRKFDVSMGLLMFGVNIVLTLVFAKRWQLIASSLDFSLPYGKIVRAIWLATFLGQFGPTVLIAETTRFQMLKRRAEPVQLIISQVLDRISGQIALFVLVLLFVPLYISRLDATFLKWLFAALSAILLGALFVRNLERSFGSLPNADRAIKVMGSPGLRGHYALSMLIQSLLVLNFILAAVGLGIKDQLWPLLVMVPMLLAATTLLPITISDWGSRETAAAFLLSSTGLAPETIVSISVMYGLAHLLAALPGGLFLVGTGRTTAPEARSNKAQP